VGFSNKNGIETTMSNTKQNIMGYNTVQSNKHHYTNKQVEQKPLRNNKVQTNIPD